MARKITIAILIVILALQGAAVGWTFDKPSGETATVMMYMCGSDLETKLGAASNDIAEMVSARRSDSVNIIIETGGAKEWAIKGVEGGANQRHRVIEGGLETVYSSPARDMTKPETLVSFISYCAENYPADHYYLVLWDHGGGSVYGFASDENFPGGALGLDGIREALSEAGVRFDFIGFDACLMATLETAVAVSPYADYLVASEEIEPESGWEYMSWLDALADDPGISAQELAEKIVDGYIYSVSDGETEGTLSVTDLAVIAKNAPAALGLFASQAKELISQNKFARLSRARQGAKAFGYDEHEMVDLADFISRSGVSSKENIVESLTSAVVYRDDTGNMREVCGLSVYFPYHALGSLDKMLNLYEEIGWNEDFADLARSFASVRENGQTMISSDQTPLSGSGGGAFDADAQASGSSWVDAALNFADYIASHYIPEDSLELSEKGDGYVLRLSDEEWDLIVNEQLNVFMDDGEGYIDLGLDDYIDYDADGDMIADFSYEWVALNGQTVAFYSGDYAERDGKFRYTGYVPAILNGVDAEIVLAWDSEHESGYVVGAREAFSSAAALTRGLTKLRQGDVIQPLCDYYLYDGSFQNAYILGDDIIVNGDIAVTYEDIGDANTLVSFLLTDIYGNTYWTESVSYE